MSLGVISPVTIVATFRVAPGREADFEQWAHDITESAAAFPGHMGATWMRSGGRYQVTYRFTDIGRFNNWHTSDVRAAFLDRLQPIATLATDENRTGLETWFELPDDPPRPAPPRWKMVIVTWIGVFPLLALIQWQVAPHVSTLLLPLRAMMFALIIVATMTYLVMPRLTAALKCWLYPA